MKQILIQLASGVFEANYDPTTGDYTITGRAPSGQEGHVTGRTYTVKKSDRAGADTNVSIDEVYNQLILTCDLEELDTLVESPTDDDTIYSPFTNKQLFCTEYASFGEGSSAFNGWKDMILRGTTQYDAAEICNHYVQLFKSKVWQFNTDSLIPTNNTGQLTFLTDARSHPCRCFLAQFGHDEPSDPKDNTMQKAPSMSTYLVITANGNRKDDSNAQPSESVLKQNQPIATYVGNLAGGLFSPTDNETTNYIVISGKIIATSANQRNSPNRLAPDTDQPFQQYHQDAQNDSGGIMSQFFMKYWHSTVHLDDDKNGDGAYYVVKYYDANSPKDTPTTRWSGSNGIIPYNDSWKSLTELPYSYSADGDETDKIKKMPLLACTLKIGEKYACETVDANGDSHYEWKTLDQCGYKKYNGESAPANHIFIGANIAIDDPIIGKEYPIANSVDPTWNIDAEGIAIPIKKSDNLTGKVSFTIDGLVNSTYDQITRIHPSFWRHTRWEHETKCVLAHINQVMIKDFDVEIYSDNAQINNIQEDKDLVYYTEQNLDYIEKKDDLEFALTTALTTEECVQKNIKNSVFQNNPYVGEEPLREIYNVNTGFSGKPEEQYLTDYWPEYSSPKQILETTIYDSDDLEWTAKMHLPEFVFDYRIRGDEYDVQKRHHTLTLRQV